MVADYKAGAVFKNDRRFKLEPVKNNPITPAGISYDFRKHPILVPSTNGTLAFTIPLD